MDQLLELARERRLDRVGATYAVAAWLVVQAASIALPAFSAPAWSLRWLIISAMAGFPLALLLAWIAASPTAVPAPKTARPLDRKDWLLMSLMGLVAILLVAQLTLDLGWRPPPRKDAQKLTSLSVTSSIAVLPFANLSGDPSKVYFSDGVADQLISEFARTPALRVAARSSSFAFRGKDVDVKTIAKALNVSTVLEGSVREDQGRVRITAELVDAANGFQIWSETYDRDLTDILRLQDDIARAITAAITKRFWGRAMSMAHAPAKARPINPEAYKTFLQGQFYLAQRTRDGVAKSISLFTRVARLAPDYADNYAALADARSVNALNFQAGSDTALASTALRRALLLDPGNATALIVKGRIALLEWRWRDVAAVVKKLDDLHIRSASAWRMRSVFFDYMALGPLALSAQQAAAQADPLSFIDQYNLALYYYVVGNTAQALRYAADAEALQPGNPDLLELQCRIAANGQRLDDAQKELDQLSAETKNGQAAASMVACMFYMDVAKKDFAAARKIADRAAATFPANGLRASDIGIGYAVTGDVSAAVTWFERGLRLRDAQIFPVFYNNPQLTKLFGDPRWKALRNEPAVRDWEEARGEIAREFQMGE